MNSRKYHKFGSLLIALPLMIIIVTGIMLLTKSNFESIQPKIRQTENKNFVPSLSFAQINSVIEKDENIKSLEKVSDIIYKPSKGIVLVRSKNNHEIQIDASNGNVLNSAPRYTSLIVSIHEGAWFHHIVKDWVFLPTGIIFLTIWFSGLQIFFATFFKRRKISRRNNILIEKQI